MNCPKCGFVQPDGLPDCQRCQVIFAKWQMRQIQTSETQVLPESVPQPPPLPMGRNVPPPPPPPAAAPPPPNDFLPQYTYIPAVRHVEEEPAGRNWLALLGLLAFGALLAWGAWAAFSTDRGLPVPSGAYRDAANGFAFVPPDKWESVNPDNLAEVMRKYGSLFPANIRELVQSGKHAAFFVDVNNARSAGDNLNVVISNQQMPRLTEADRKDLERQFSDEGRKYMQDFKISHSELTKIDKLQAMRLEFEGVMALPALRTSLKLKASQLYVPGDGRTFIVTCGSEAHPEDCDQVFSSFRVLKRPTFLGGSLLLAGAVKGGLIGGAIALFVGMMKWLLGGN